MKLALDSSLAFKSTDLMPTAFLLSSTLRLGVYDCVYIALSQRESCLVVTADQRLGSES